MVPSRVVRLRSTRRLAAAFWAALLAAPQPGASAQDGPVGEPRKTVHVNPYYPDEPRLNGVQDMVFIHAVVDEKGRVTKAKVLRGRPEFTKVTLGAVERWQYEPATLNGKPISITVTIVNAFFLKGLPKAPIVTAAFKDQNEFGRAKAIEYAPNVRGEDEVILATVKEALADPSELVRAAARRAIAQLESPHRKP